MGKTISLKLVVFNVENIQDYFHCKSLYLNIEYSLFIGSHLPKHCVSILDANEGFSVFSVLN